MALPTFNEARIYKSRAIQSRIWAAVELDYPVYSGDFHDTFPGAALDDDLWFSFLPSWGFITVAGGTVSVGATGNTISPAWIQSRHNLAFPLRRDTDWTFYLRCQFPTVTGFGVFIRICGRSFRDAEAIWALKCNLADGLEVHFPDGFTADNTIWSTVNGVPFRRYQVFYDASAQTYTASIDQNDDGVWDWVRTIDVNDRYADAIVIGNSTAIQGILGPWTEIEVDEIRVQGTAETVMHPEWAAPFSYDGTTFSRLPTVLDGRIHIHKDNVIDVASLTLDNFGIDDDGSLYGKLYSRVHFMNRRAIIWGQAGDGNGNWAPIEVLFSGLCSEKQLELREDGECRVTLPMRDRWRAIADDKEVLACYSDAVGAIPGVGMNMTVAQIIADVYQNECGMPATSHNLVATPWNTPRNYNIYRTGGQRAIRTLCDHAALACWQRRSDARIEVQEWEWGDDMPLYFMSTSEEIRMLRWTERAFDATSGEQMAFMSTDFAGGGFTATWPPHREPFYGRVPHADSVAAQGQLEIDNRPITALRWWIANRKLAGVVATCLAQFWVEHDDQVGVYDGKFLDLAGEAHIIDGWEHSWRGDETAVTRLYLTYPHPDLSVRRNLRA